MRCCFFFILLFCTSEIFGQHILPDQDSLIEIAYKSTSVKSPESDAVKYLLVKAENATDFKRVFANEIRRQLSEQWFIIDKASLAMDSQKLKLEVILQANNNWKLSPLLLQQKNKLSDQINTFLVEVSDTVAFEKLIAINSRVNNISYRKVLKHLFYVVTSINFLEEYVLDRDFILSIDLKSGPPKEESVINDYDNSTNGINLLAAEYPEADGRGLTASIKENMFDTLDIDFKNRYKLTGLGSILNTSHATTMATFIAGGGNSFYTGRGVVPSVEITSSDFANLLPDGNTYQQYNISVQNHSYGTGIENFYGSDAAAYDESMIANPALLHVFSAGNSGDSYDSLSGGQYSYLKGFANITGSFKMAKNVLTVGSVDSFFIVPLLSSKGPAYDGRIKPELAAYGNDGSSGAAAITSGTVLAVQSAYAQMHAGLLPVNSLTKAIIINSGEDINKPGPDFYSGYGNVDAYRAVKDMLSEKYFKGAVANGETEDFTIHIPPAAKNLKITLVWSDPPAATNAYTALVNDLDLKVQKQNSTWLPWVLNSAPYKDSLNQPAKRKRDSLNVVEQVTIDNPPEGDYIINVSGYHIPEGVQAFSVAYRWDTLDHFYFVAPAAKDHFTSGDKSIFRWKSTYAAGTKAKLEYSIDKGITWRLINNALDLESGYYNWITPDIFSPALARITIGSDLFVSDTFNFSKQLFPQVGFNCGDSVLIFWNKAPGVNNYKIYNLGDKYLQTLGTTTDTSFVILNSASPYIAVTTLLADGNTGVNSYTFNYNTQGTGCYISNFLADLTSNNTAKLQLTLGTIYNITSIGFQKLTRNGWQTLQTISPVNNSENNSEDNTLYPGINAYRAVIMLKNGAEIISDTIAVYFTGNNSFVLLPNPVSQGQNLTILSGNFQVNTLVIYDITGRKVLQQEISNTRTDIPVAHLARGIYIVTVYNANAKLFTGKIVVQ